MWAGERCVPVRRNGLVTVGGELPGGFTGLAWEVTVKDYGVAVTRPQGQSRAPSPSTEKQ